MFYGMLFILVLKGLLHQNIIVYFLEECFSLNHSVISIRKEVTINNKNHSAFYGT